MVILSIRVPITEPPDSIGQPPPVANPRKPSACSFQKDMSILRQPRGVAFGSRFGWCVM